ncbi:Dipeptide-binding protein DppE precursor [Rhodobacteraceae bacterium THAF1]|uniref:ABC transporter substrate-binding protein n=1 Tax=Palleronia sp. THAF1 TaxID=2587842 RepID=UPI000F41DD40|nr:ABC transporter substrate-binding protein [Palleronia sp. THAF1]QFU08897.1 Dipeptide-binding protein DppE precursor [Palleronia sp. THAF1]VDC24391.1 Dipeptide-binding protein DppE precursor [Rhodobacteraceae bacterium THAF1]
MSHSTDRIHPAAKMHATEYQAGKISRREFLTRATALGVSATAAYGLIGAAAPAHAEQHTMDGGTLRIQMEVRALKDPRVTDWPQIANIYRGWLEYLTEYQADGTIRPMLLESYEVSDDATTYTLKLREGITWNNGDAFTAEHVAHNFRRWCEKGVEGNSMASRMGDMVDPDSGTIKEGILDVQDDLTLVINLTSPDIALMASVSDYPGALVHPSYDGGDMTSGAGLIGTGPYTLEDLSVGVKTVLVKNADHQWWGAEAEGFGGASLERIEYIDYGTDPAAWLAAIESEEVDMLYESVGEFIEIMDSLDLVKSETITASTIVIRCNQEAEVNGEKPYADVRVRKALQMAVDNSVLLELGYSGLGEVAENHHVCPIHPEYAEVDNPVVYDPEGAMALLEEAGMADYEHELVSIDDDWRKNTTDACAAQLRDAGIRVNRSILPGNTFWNDWAKFPFSSTDWNQRPLGVQTLSLAYRSGEAWNECAYANPEFDAKLSEAMGIADADERRVIMKEIEQLMIDDGVIIQPYWRSIYRHYTQHVTGAEVHPLYEIPQYKLGLSA